jgi:ABC-type xylose transport system permease subunit
VQPPAETKTWFIDLSAYPPWLVVLAGTLAAVLFIYVTMKLLKWTLWILLILVLCAGTLWSMWLLLHGAPAKFF